MDSHSNNPITVVHQSAPATQLHPLVQMMQAAMTSGGAPDIGMMREIMQLQREWQTDVARKAYTTSLIALKSVLPTVIRRDKKVDFGNTTYTHTSLACVMDAVTEPLHQHGFSLAWIPATTSNGVSVTCRITHVDGHFEECTLSGPPDTKGSKSPVQGVMSTITMLERYTALAILGIATADMKEPEPQGTTEDTVDPERNLAAVSKLARFGKTREDAEVFLGKPVKEWTVGDLQRLAAWAKPPKQQEE
jgi:hypothetical protein